METEQVTQTEQIVSPAGEVVSPSQIAETITTEVPAALTEDRELQDAHAAIEQAKTPEDKERAREGYQRRVEAKETKEIKERARALELENARLQGRMEAMGQAGQHQVQPQIVQEPQIPAPILPPRPDPKLWTDADGYEDQDKKTEILADWRADCKFAERDHQHTVERMRSDSERQAREGNALVTEIIQAHPDFADKMQLHRPSPVIGESIGVLAQIDKKAAIETAYHLVNNPAELQRLNAMTPEVARIALGRLAANLPATPPPKTTTHASPPIVPVTPSAPTAPIDFSRLSVEEIIAERNREEFGR